MRSPRTSSARRTLRRHQYGAVQRGLHQLPEL